MLPRACPRLGHDPGPETHPCMASLLSRLPLLAALALPMVAQSTLVIPNGLAATPGNTNNAFPWSRGTASMRIQFLYDPSHFTLQGVNGPIVISRLRWRPYSSTTAGTWAGGTWPNVRIDLSTAATTWSAPSTTFASNLGADVSTVYQGPVTVIGGTVPASTVGPWYIDVATTPFVYNPTTGGNLLIDIHLDGTGWTGASRAADHQSTGSMAARVYNTSGLTSPTGTVGTSYGAVVEVSHVPAVGLFPSFGATPRSGASPLTVQFSDSSFTSDPAGILAWAWDVDGDNVVDYTVQNPSHTYTGCGNYTVSLTVTDAANGPRTLTRANFIATDELTPSFTSAVLAGNVVQFTDTTVPTPSTWDWDLDGDGLTDSTAQNPVFVYGSGCVGAPARLTVTRNCRGPYTTLRNVIFAPNSISYLTGSTSTSSTTWVGGLFDVQVTNPQGVSICAVSVRPSVVGPFSCEVYITPDTYLGKDTNIAAWRKVASGTGFPGTSPLPVALYPPCYLPPGNYGMAVYVSQPGGISTSLTYNSVPTTGHPGPISNADLTLFPNPAVAPGMIRTGLFGGGLLNPRIWNGTLHYGTCGATGDAGYGFFAPGCSGSLGIPGNVPMALPRLGQTMRADLTHLPLNAAMMMLGFSNTASSFGALPLDLGIFGAPGCLGRVSPDTVVLVLGAGNTATFGLSLPNNPALLCMQFYTQGLVFDVGINSLGAVTSDAAAGIIGQ